MYGCWEGFCLRVLPRSAELLEPRDDYTTVKTGVEGPRVYCGWRIENVAISMREGDVGVRQQWCFLKLDSLGRDETFHIDAFHSCTIQLRTLIVPHPSVSSCSVL